MLSPPRRILFSVSVAAMIILGSAEGVTPNMPLEHQPVFESTKTFMQSGGTAVPDFQLRCMAIIIAEPHADWARASARPSEHLGPERSVDAGSATKWHCDRIDGQDSGRALCEVTLMPCVPVLIHHTSTCREVNLPMPFRYFIGLTVLSAAVLIGTLLYRQLHPNSHQQADEHIARSQIASYMYTRRDVVIRMSTITALLFTFGHPIMVTATAGESYL